MRCPILPLTKADFDQAAINLGENPDTVRGIYWDTPGTEGVITKLQRALVQQGAQDETGYSPQINGLYDYSTASALRLWATARNLLADDILIGIIGPVTTCRIYRSLGVSCDSVYVVPRVTPNQDMIIEAIRAGWRFECLGAPGPGGISPGMLVSLGLLAVGGYLAYRLVKG